MNQIESATQKLSIQDDVNSSSVLDISLDAELSASKLKEELEKNWKTTQKTPEFTLSKSRTLIKLDNFFASKEIRQILKQGHTVLKTLQSKRPFPFSSDFFDLVFYLIEIIITFSFFKLGLTKVFRIQLKKYPIYPMPTIVSKLYLCFALYSSNEKRKCM